MKKVNKNLKRVLGGFYVFLMLLGMVSIDAVPRAMAASADDDYLRLDRKMRENRAANPSEKKEKVVLVEETALTEKEKEILKQIASDNEAVRERAQQELRNIEQQKKEAENELARQKLENQKKEEEAKKAKEEAKIEEYERKVKEIEIEKEKIKLKEQELEEYNKKVADQEKKIKEQQEKIKEEEKKILAKQEEFRLQNIQREKEAERQLLIKQKELEEAAAKKQKELEESAAKKQKELEEVAAKKQEELNALKEKNEEIKDVIALSNTKVSQEISEQKKERELLKQQIDILRTEQEKNFQEIRRLNAIYYGSPRKGAVKNSNYSDSVFMVNKIESNLTHSAKSGKKIGDAFVNIKKGAWADEDLIEVEKTEFEIKKTVKGKKEDAGVLTETAKETKTLKDKAYEAIKNKDFEVAALYYRRVLEKDGADNFAKLSLATTYHTMGQYRQAKPLYLELMDVFPRSEQLVSNLISIMIQESPQETVYLIPGVADKHQDSALIQAQTSIAFAAAGKYPEAIKYIRRALAIVPGNIDFKYNLALFYDFNRNYEEAKRLYNEVLTADFSNKVRNDSIRKRLSSM